MSDQLFSTPTGPRGALRARPAGLRVTSPSPSRQQRPSDDLLSRLTPATALEALQSPTGPLKACLDRASVSEQSFALKTAIASKAIHRWLIEVSDWPWPSTGTASGFDMPPSSRNELPKRRTPQDSDTPLSPSGVAYFGSVSAGDVIQREKRIEQIQQDMETLDLEDIKNQVLHNHILPLSRPGTPFSDAGLSTTSAFSFTKMEDLTAVVTAITVQTLPALSKLSRLLRTWTLRLIVLRRVPSLLVLITDAEVALVSGWSAIGSSRTSSDTTGAAEIGSSTQLSQKDFEVIKSVLLQKITRPGQDLDFMLDTLEGTTDTLPEEWLDRMESIERDYAEWATMAERRVREAELSSRTQEDSRLHQPTQLAKAASIKPNNGTSGGQRNATYDGSEDPEDICDDSSHGPILSEVNRNIVRQSPDQVPSREALLKPVLDEDFEPSILASVHEEDEEPELPPTYLQARKDSDPSDTFTAFRGSSNWSPGYSDRGAFHEASMEPELPYLRNPDEPFSSDAISPPSSPPLRFKPRSTSVTFKHVPEIAMLPETEYSPPRTPLNPAAVLDQDTSFDWDVQSGSPRRMSTSSASNDDDHLQKQLRELLQTIPARIELKRRGINLNPPDLQLPSQLPPRPRPRLSDASRRPTSALSSRTESRGVTPSYSRSATPSFMLAPVRDTRPRSTSSQGIRLYHLSRSGETPIKLFIRCVGEQNERVMVRVGGGWSDLGEYLRDYAIHHGSRSKGEGKVQVTDAVPAANKRVGSSPGSRPGSAHGSSPMTPLVIRKTRRNPGEEVVSKAPKTPLANVQESSNTPASEVSARSRASSRVNWDEEDSSLGLAGPKAARRREISDESRAWIESVKQKVRLASGDRIPTSISSEQLRPPSSLQPQGLQKKASNEKFGEIGKAGSTKRLFRRN